MRFFTRCRAASRSTPTRSWPMAANSATICAVVTPHLRRCTQTTLNRSVGRVAPTILLTAALSDPSSRRSNSVRSARAKARRKLRRRTTRATAPRSTSCKGFVIALASSTANAFASLSVNPARASANHGATSRHCPASVNRPSRRRKIRATFSALNCVCEVSKFRPCRPCCEHGRMGS